MHIEVTLFDGTKTIVMTHAIRTIQPYTDPKHGNVNSMISLIGITGQVLYLYITNSYTSILNKLNSDEGIEPPPPQP